MFRSSILAAILTLLVTGNPGGEGSPSVTDDPVSSLHVTIEPVTATADADETTPVLGDDGLTDLVVYASFGVAGSGHAPGNIYYRRLSPDGVPFSQGPLLVSLDPDGSSDDRLNDVSGGYIVYTALDPALVATGIIKLYDIRRGATSSLMAVADQVREARIHGNIVAWVQGGPGATRIQMVDVTSPTLTANTISGSNPAQNVDVGSRFVVWEETAGSSLDIVAYDMASGLIIAVTSDAAKNERAPSTSGDWVVWQEQVGTNTRILARNLATGDPAFVVANPGARVQNPGINGDYIGYESQESGNFDVYLYRLSTGTTHRVTSGPHDERRRCGRPRDWRGRRAHHDRGGYRNRRVCRRRLARDRRAVLLP